MRAQANESTADFLPFGRYLLERRLAVGGMAEVFLAHLPGPSSFSKRVVIKRLLEHLANDDEAVALFLDEAKLAARFTHPNLVQVYELSQINGQYCTVMEYLEGADLRELLMACARMRIGVPEPIAALLVARAAEALDYVHRLADDDSGALHIVHADISPGNIVLTRQGEVKVVDFGVAKHAGARERSGAVRGKPGYMAPEQIRNADVDARADVYGLGVVLYELLSGKPYVDPQTALVMADSDRERHAGERLRALHVDAHIATVLREALEPDRERRTASAAAVQHALEGYLATVKRPLAADVARFAEHVLPSGGDASTRLRTATHDATHVVHGRFTDPRLVLRPETVDLLVREATGETKRLPKRRWAFGAALVCAGVLTAIAVLKERAPAPARTSPAPLAHSPAPPAAQPPAPVVEEKIVTPARPDPTPPARKSAHPRRRARHRATPPPPAPDAIAEQVSGRGKVAFIVEPWADVYLGDRHLGTTPMAPVTVPEGRQQFRLVSPDTGREKTVAVVVIADATVKVVENLR